MNDKQIIDLYFSRSEQSIKETKIKYSSFCRKIAYNILSNNEDTDECENDTYLKIWNSIPPNRPENLAGYLAKIVRNLALNCYEKKHAAKRGGGQVEMSYDELSECMAGKGRVDENLEKNELSCIISKFLKQKGEQKRTIFIQRYFYFAEISDIADRMGMKESSVRSALSRMRKELKNYLEQEGIAI